MPDPIRNPPINATNAAIPTVLSASSRAPAVATPAPSPDTSVSRLRDWIVAHDDKWLFLVLYIGLAVVLSVWISLFWLVVVVAAHFALELVRQSHRHQTTSRVVLEAVWELKLDIALVFFALALALYMEVVLGVVGLQAAGRLGAASKVAARFAGWERTLRAVVLSADDAAQVVRAVSMRRGAAPAAGAAVLAGENAESGSGAGSPQPTWREPWTVGTWIALGLGAACTALIIAAPLLTSHSAASTVTTLLTELRPLP